MAWSSVCRVSASRSGQSWRNRHRSHVQKHVLDRLHPGPHRGVAVRRQPPPRPLRQWPHQPPADHRWPRPRVRVTSQQCEKSMLGHADVLSLSLSQTPVLGRLEQRRAEDRALQHGRDRPDGAGAGRPGAAQRIDLWPPEPPAVLGRRRSDDINNRIWVLIKDWLHSFMKLTFFNYLIHLF